MGINTVFRACSKLIESARGPRMAQQHLPVQPVMAITAINVQSHAHPIFPDHLSFMAIQSVLHSILPFIETPNNSIFFVLLDEYGSWFGHFFKHLHKYEYKTTFDVF